jgi:hypothetical protein
MAFGRENVSVRRTNGAADVFCLAGLLRDDNLIGLIGLIGLIRHSEAPERVKSLPRSRPAPEMACPPCVQKADHRENADRITASDGGLWLAAAISR